MKPFIFFDMDGVLADTKDLIRQAYEEAGVKFVDDYEWDNVYGKPWYNWLLEYCDYEEDMALAIHKRKQECYFEILDGIQLKKTGATKLLAELLKTKEWYACIASGASETSIRHILEKKMKLDIEFIIPNASASTKLSRAIETDLLRKTLTAPYTSVVMVDDDEQIVEAFRQADMPVVHYTGQNKEHLKKEIIDQWTLSSLRPDETNDSQE